MSFGHGRADDLPEYDALATGPGVGPGRRRKSPTWREIIARNSGAVPALDNINSDLVLGLMPLVTR